GLQALPTERQARYLLKKRALQSRIRAPGSSDCESIHALAHSGPVAIPHSGSRLFRPCPPCCPLAGPSSCNPAFGLQALPTHTRETDTRLSCKLQSRIRAPGSSDSSSLAEWRDELIVAIPHSGSRLFRRFLYFNPLIGLEVAIPHSGSRLFRPRPCAA